MQKIPPNVQRDNLTMTKSDAQVAIIQAFRSEFDTISFVGDVNPIKISDDPHSIHFTIQGEFNGTGSYEVLGTVKLIVSEGDGIQSHMLYKASGKVNISENDGSPIAVFNNPITIKRK